MRLELDAWDLAKSLANQWPNAPTVAPYPCGFADAIRIAIEVCAEQLSLRLPALDRSAFVESFYREAGLVRIYVDSRPAWKTPWPPVQDVGETKTAT